MSAGMFLCNATRFKLSFSTSGTVSCLQPYAKELEGRWVALVSADDDKHIGMADGRDQLKGANDELREALGLALAALEENVGMQDTYIDFAQVRAAKDAARAALTKHQGATT